MKQSEMQRVLEREITRNAYQARMCEHIKLFGFDTGMMEYHQRTGEGKG